MRRLTLSLAISLALLVGCKQTTQAPNAPIETPTTGKTMATFAFEEASIASLQQQMSSGALSSTR